MHISKLVLRNFRNFHKASFSFTKGVNTLIGENGAGKSNALYAMRLLIDDTLARRAVRLTEDDFCRVLPDWRGHWIVIALDFDELDLSEGCQVIRHGVGRPEEPASGRLTLYFRPTAEARKRLFEASLEEGDALDRERRSLTLDNYEACFVGRASADFLDDDVYHAVVGDFDAGTVPDPSEDDARLSGTPTHGFHQEVTCTFVRALRDVVADLRGTRGNPLLTLLRGSEKTIEVADVESITNAVRELNSSLSALDEVQEVSTGVRETMLNAIGRTYAPDIEIASELPDDMERLLKHLALRVGDGSGHRGSIDDIGLGGANLVFIALKLLEYELKLASERVAHFLLIEEPEAHIHPHVQRTLFEKYKAKRTQVIVTSHSTHLSSVANIRSMSVLARRSDCAAVFAPSRGLTDPECERIERYLDAVRGTLLFAKGVVLVEGDAEALLIPTLTRQVLGLGLDEMGVSLVNVGGAVFRGIAPLFHPSRLQRPCAIVTDLDSPIAPLPENPEDDDAIQAHMRAAAKAGKTRSAEISELTADNPWIEGFIAETTFEVEFLRAGNQDLAVAALPGVYAKAENIERSKRRLESNDISIAGGEILRLAEREGKGWFALSMSGLVTPASRIPLYILRALAFASRVSLNHASMVAMCQHRLAIGVVSAKGFRPAKGATEEQYVQAYVRAFPKDQVTHFIEALGASRGD